MQCDGVLKRQSEKTLDDVQFYINGAVAAANKCATKLAMELYNKADRILMDIISNNGCCTRR